MTQVGQKELADSCKLNIQKLLQPIQKLREKLVQDDSDKDDDEEEEKFEEMLKSKSHK